MEAIFAVALIRGGLLSGYVNFTEISNLTVRVQARIEGFERKEEIQFFGFHVHEYGDVRDELSYERLGQHFSPNCAFPPGNASQKELEEYETCLDFQVHGYPPSYRRRSGELGNITVIDGVGVYDYIVRQDKMSLSDPRLSIIGRSMCVHENRDDGSQPYGNSGAIVAAGVIEAITSTARAASSEFDLLGDGGVAVLLSSDAKYEQQEIHVLLSESNGVRLVIKNAVLEDGSYALQAAIKNNMELVRFNVSQKFRGSYVTAENDVLTLGISQLLGRRIQVIRNQDNKIIASGVVGISPPRAQIDSAVRAAVAYYPMLGGSFTLTELDGVNSNILVTGSAVLPSDEEVREFRGFHVHQYGDVRTPLVYERLGYHFIAPCKFSFSSDLVNNSCFVTHGYPPSATRLNGELGNATVITDKEDGKAIAIYDYVSKQEKMSLSDDLLSVIGRSLVVHELRDDGSPPWGNSGGASLAAVIEAANPTDYYCVDNAVSATTATTEANFLIADFFSSGGLACIVALVPDRLGLVCEDKITATLEIRQYRKSVTDASGPILYSDLGTISNEATLDIDLDKTKIDTTLAAGRILALIMSTATTNNKSNNVTTITYAAPLGFATRPALIEVFTRTGRLDCAWSDWSDWSECRGQCNVFNGGSRNRSRTRDVAVGLFEDYNSTCSDFEVETQPCYQPCPIGDSDGESSTKKRTSTTASERTIAITALIAVVIALIILGAFLWFAIKAAIDKFYGAPTDQDPKYMNIQQQEGDVELQYSNNNVTEDKIKKPQS